MFSGEHRPFFEEPIKLEMGLGLPLLPMSENPAVDNTDIDERNFGNPPGPSTSNSPGMDKIAISGQNIGIHKETGTSCSAGPTAEALQVDDRDRHIVGKVIFEYYSSLF